jgi:UDP-N-acetylmuramoylalanine--D-glutamate ligase
MFFGLYPGKKVAVTGTRGKSTTATLIHQLLKTEIKNNVLAGNIATTPMFSVLDKIKKDAWPVLELSSWQLENLDEYKQAPEIAIVTNVLVDHLNRYKNFNEYAKAKFAITRWQTKNDSVILNYDNKVTRAMAKKTQAKVYWFSLNKKVIRGAYVFAGDIYFTDGKKLEKIMPLNQLAILGEHNLANVLAALIVAKLLNIDNKNIIKVLKSFSGIDYRLQYKGIVKGRAVYNDSTATTPDATQAAIKALLPKKILLIAGGQDKVLDYKDLAKLIKAKVSYLILLSGTGSDKLIQELKKINFPSTKLKANVPSLNAAWKLALKYKNTDCILFSPAAASFNMFLHEFDRAKQFNKLVNDFQKK